VNSPERNHLISRRTILLTVGAGLFGFACRRTGEETGGPKPTVTSPPPKKVEPARMKCGVCGMHVDPDSENRFEMTDTKDKKHNFCSSVCAIAYSDVYPPKAGGLTVYDYETHKMIDPEKAFHLFDSKLEVAGAMPPAVAAFGTRAAADAAAKKHGGKVLKWGELRAAIRKTEDYKDSRVPKEQSQLSPAGADCCVQ
jgi:nitrous oxide reductase accessory protein NosL